MDLCKKNIYIPGFVPGANVEEKVQYLVAVMAEVSTPKEKHMLRYTKRKRIKKKYFDRLLDRALLEIFCRKVAERIAELDKGAESDE